MRKLYTLLAILFSNVVFSQNLDKLKIFKFNPLPLITSTLSFSIEDFNVQKDRSNQFTFGLRYDKNDRNYYPQNLASDNFSTWKGITGAYERRFYIPAFVERPANLLNAEGSSIGVYLAPSIRLDYNNFEENYEYNEIIYDPEKQQNVERYVFSNSNINYFGVMPAVHLGLQFSVFKYGFIDLFLGGGLRVNFKDVNSASSTNNPYSTYSNAISELIIREGVRPSGGVSIGVNL